MKFKKTLLVTTAILGLAAGIAIGQVTQPQVTGIGTSDLFPIIPSGVPTAQSQFASLARMRSATLAGTGGHTGTPVVSVCGTGGGTVAGNDYAFLLTQGSTANTACVVTFATHFNAAPVCIVQNENLLVTVNIVVAAATTNITITQPSLTGQIYAVHCEGLTGG